MNRVLWGLLASFAALALIAVPDVATADWDDWFNGGWGDEQAYGEREYGFGLEGAYDDENANDDWYYDSYNFNDGVGNYGGNVGGDITDQGYSHNKYLNKSGGGITDDDYLGGEYTDAEGYLDGDFGGDEDLYDPSEGYEGYGYYDESDF